MEVNPKSLDTRVLFWVYHSNVVVRLFHLDKIQPVLGSDKLVAQHIQLSCMLLMQHSLLSVWEDLLSLQILGTQFIISRAP